MKKLNIAFFMILILWCQTGFAQYLLDSNNFGSGGEASNGSYELLQSLGQPIIGMTQDSTNIIYEVGFLYRVREEEEILDAVFSASDTIGIAPLTVQFSDQSTGNPNSWLWDFGDGETDTIQNPIHTYQNTGEYEVSLTIWNAQGDSDAITKQNYITVFEPNYYTLILTHSTQLENLYSTTAKDSIISKLNEFAVRPDVQGLVIDLAAIDYSAWNNNYANNTEANQITDQIWEYLYNEVDGVLNEYPNIQHMVIVGDDRIVPGRRVNDKVWFYDESYYTDVEGELSGFYFSSVCNDTLFLSDDFYAHSYQYADTTSLFVPEIPIGRLTGDAAAITGIIDDFMESDGNLNLPVESAVIGSEWYYELSAEEQYDLLTQNSDFSPLTNLYDVIWTESDFMTHAVNPDSALAIISQHGTHKWIKAANGDTLHYYEIPVSMTKKLWASLACHAGLNPPDVNSLANTLSESGMPIYISSTGYTYFSILYTGWAERLLSHFTEELATGSGTIGQRFWAAKQAYLNYHPEFFNNFDRKTVQTFSFYGLPMYQLNSGAVLGRPPIATLTTPSQRSQRSGILTVETVTLNDLDATYSEITDPNGYGSYYVSDGKAISGDISPVMPSFEYSLNTQRSTGRVKGIVMLSLEYMTTSIDPVIGGIGAVEPMSDDEDTYDTDDDWMPGLSPGFLVSGYEPVLQIVGQGRGDQDQMDIRLPKDVSLKIYRSTNEMDWMPPTLISFKGDVSIEDNFLIHYRVEATDESGIDSVYVSITDNITDWFTIGLTENPDSAGVWEGDLDAVAENLVGTNAQYIIQIVDGAGNVGVWQNGGAYYNTMDLEGKFIASDTLRVYNAGIDSSVATTGVIGDNEGEFDIPALAPGDSVDIPITFINDHYVTLDMDVNGGVNEELDETDNVVYAPTMSTLSLKCLLQGNLADTLTVELRTSIDGSSINAFTVVPDGNGLAQMSVNSGDYYIVVDHFNHLAVVSAQSHTFTSGETTVVDFTLEETAYQCDDNHPMIYNSGTDNWEMRAGDVNEDNVINVFDFGLFGQSYGSECGDDNYNRNADFNLDCVINVFDFGIFGQNYGKESCVVFPAASREIDKHFNESSR